MRPSLDKGPKNEPEVFSTHFLSAPRGLGLGHTPSTAGTFRQQFRKNSGKTPETLSELFLEFPSRAQLGSPKGSRAFREFSPPQPYTSFSEVVPERASQAGHGIPSSTGGISEGHPSKIPGHAREKELSREGGMKFSTAIFRVEDPHLTGQSPGPKS